MQLMKLINRFVQLIREVNSKWGLCQEFVVLVEKKKQKTDEMSTSRVAHGSKVQTNTLKVCIFRDGSNANEFY